MSDSKQVFIGTIPEDYFDALMTSARELNISNDVFVKSDECKDADTFEEIEEQLTVYTTKPELSRDLWDRYCFHVNFPGLKDEIERMTDG